MLDTHASARAEVHGMLEQEGPMTWPLMLDYADAHGWPWTPGELEAAVENLDYRGDIASIYRNGEILWTVTYRPKPATETILAVAELPRMRGYGFLAGLAVAFGLVAFLVVVGGLVGTIAGWW